MNTVKDTGLDGHSPDGSASESTPALTRAAVARRIAELEAIPDCHLDEPEELELEALIQSRDSLEGRAAALAEDLRRLAIAIEAHPELAPADGEAGIIEYLWGNGAKGAHLKRFAEFAEIAARAAKGTDMRVTSDQRIDALVVSLAMPAGMLSLRCHGAERVFSPSPQRPLWPLQVQAALGMADTAGIDSPAAQSACPSRKDAVAGLPGVDA